MKFDDVITEAGIFKFGNDKSAEKAPSIKGGTNRATKLSKKIFLDDFSSDLIGSIQSGLQSGLIQPPIIATANENYNRLNQILETVIMTSENTASASAGMDIKTYIAQWLGQYMQGVDYTAHKPALSRIIDQIAVAYNNSTNPNSPNIDRNLVTQLGNGGWAASKSVVPKGAKNSVPGSTILPPNAPDGPIDHDAADNTGDRIDYDEPAYKRVIPREKFSESAKRAEKLKNLKK